MSKKYEVARRQLDNLVAAIENAQNNMTLGKVLGELGLQHDVNTVKSKLLNISSKIDDAKN